VEFGALSSVPASLISASSEVSVAITVSPLARKRSTKSVPIPPAAPVMMTMRFCFI